MYKDLKIYTELTSYILNITVAERFVCLKRYFVKNIEDIKNENISMSNKKRN